MCWSSFWLLICLQQPQGNVAWRKTLLQADAAIAKVAKVPTMAFSSRVGSIEQPFDPKMKQILLGSSVRQFHGQPVGSRCNCSLR